jgi:hypothetical protein
MVSKKDLDPAYITGKQILESADHLPAYKIHRDCGIQARTGKTGRQKKQQRESVLALTYRLIRQIILVRFFLILP